MKLKILDKIGCLLFGHRRRNISKNVGEKVMFCEYCKQIKIKK